jgi:hypothetical protein
MGGRVSAVELPVIASSAARAGPDAATVERLARRARWLSWLSLAWMTGRDPVLPAGAVRRGRVGARAGRRRASRPHPRRDPPGLRIDRLHADARHRQAAHRRPARLGRDQGRRPPEHALRLPRRRAAHRRAGQHLVRRLVARPPGWTPHRRGRGEGRARSVARRGLLRLRAARPEHLARTLPGRVLPRHATTASASDARSRRAPSSPTATAAPSAATAIATPKADR